jgi:hypothetical protein
MEAQQLPVLFMKLSKRGHMLKEFYPYLERKGDFYERVLAKVIYEQYPSLRLRQPGLYSTLASYYSWPIYRVPQSDLPIDGTTDCTATIQAYIDNNPKTRIVLPRGVFRVNNTTKLSGLDNRSLEGTLDTDGITPLTTIKPVDGYSSAVSTTVVRASSGSNVPVKRFGLANLIIDGNMQNFAQLGSAISAYGFYASNGTTSAQDLFSFNVWYQNCKTYTCDILETVGAYILGGKAFTNGVIGGTSANASGLEILSTNTVVISYKVEGISANKGINIGYSTRSIGNIDIINNTITKATNEGILIHDNANNIRVMDNYKENGDNTLTGTSADANVNISSTAGFVAVRNNKIEIGTKNNTLAIHKLSADATSVFSGNLTDGASLST